MEIGDKSHSDQLKLTLIDEKEVEAFFYLVSRNEQMLHKYFPKTVQNASTKLIAKRSIDNYTLLHKRKEMYVYMLKLGKEVLGIFFLKNIDLRIRKAELAYFIDASQCNKGWATKGVKQLMEIVRDDIHLNKVYARVDPANIASCRVLEKVGFLLEGVLRKEFQLPNKELIDLNYFGKLL